MSHSRYTFSEDSDPTERTELWQDAEWLEPDREDPNNLPIPLVFNDPRQRAEVAIFKVHDWLMELRIRRGENPVQRVTWYEYHGTFLESLDRASHRGDLAREAVLRAQIEANQRARDHALDVDLAIALRRTQILQVTAGTRVLRSHELDNIVHEVLSRRIIGEYRGRALAHDDGESSDEDDYLADDQIVAGEEDFIESRDHLMHAARAVAADAHLEDDSIRMPILSAIAEVLVSALGWPALDAYFRGE